MNGTLRIAIATPPRATSIAHGVGAASACVAEAARLGARVICFPEAYLPGLRGLDFPVPAWTEDDQQAVVQALSAVARAQQIVLVMGMEWLADGRRFIASAVFGADGALQGIQTKNQLDPSEEQPYDAGETRRLFHVDGIPFGITICHEGFRYPETVRWAATRGAKLVFHPHCTGSDERGPTLTTWGDPGAPYYEKAMMCRALENFVWFASSNYGFRYQESASSVIAPNGTLAAHQPYGVPGVLVHDIDLSQATGLLASRYAPERYREAHDPF